MSGEWPDGGNLSLIHISGSGSKLITETADKLRELFEFQDDDRLSYQAVSSIAVGDMEFED